MTHVAVEVKKGFRKHQMGVSEKSSRLDGKASRLNNVSGDQLGGYSRLVSQRRNWAVDWTKVSTGFLRNKPGSRQGRVVDWICRRQSK